jgi:hypothetical protein
MHRRDRTCALRLGRTDESMTYRSLGIEVDLTILDPLGHPYFGFKSEPESRHICRQCQRWPRSLRTIMPCSPPLESTPAGMQKPCTGGLLVSEAPDSVPSLWTWRVPSEALISEAPRSLRRTDLSSFAAGVGLNSGSWRRRKFGLRAGGPCPSVPWSNLHI